jgi:ribokinase
VSAPIFVVGSLNMDFVARVNRLPVPGETVLGGDFLTICGGKGANQACAAARLGGSVRMIGRVGEDVFGVQLRDGLQASGVDVRAIHRTKDIPTGVALIFVDAAGQNEIVVAPGANGALTPDDVETVLSHATGGYLLIQLETPLETVMAAARAARSRGLTVILDPAPAQPLPPALLSAVDILTPNETEALTLLGRQDTSVSFAGAQAVAGAIRALNGGTAIVKLGANGAYVSGSSEEGHFAAPTVNVVDTTAAGDTFNGAFAVALAEGHSLARAVTFANAAAALSVTRAGAQASIPTRDEVESQPARAAVPGSGGV